VVGFSYWERPKGKRQKMNIEKETCKICFEDYLIKNTKEHQCVESWSCGACGEICETEDGTIALNQGLKEFTHKPELCPAQDEETWANLPTTCPDFVSHPHLVNGRGCYTCQIALASEDQGTTALMSALLDKDISCDVHQTGGFTMCVYIKTGEESYVYANAEGFSFYKNAECEGWANYYFSEAENTPKAKAEAISQTMKVAGLTAQEI
jgi:hypothetical protein